MFTVHLGCPNVFPFEFKLPHPSQYFPLPVPRSRSLSCWHIFYQFQSRSYFSMWSEDGLQIFGWSTLVGGGHLYVSPLLCWSKFFWFQIFFRRHWPLLSAPLGLYTFSHCSSMTWSPTGGEIISHTRVSLFFDFFLMTWHLIFSSLGCDGSACRLLPIPPEGFFGPSQWIWDGGTRGSVSLCFWITLIAYVTVNDTNLSEIS